MRSFFRVLAIVVLLVGAGALAGTFVPRPLDAPSDAAAEDPHRILMLSNPIHTDIAIRLDARTRGLLGYLDVSPVPIADPAAEWIVFGWGGRAFYLETPTWADLKAGPVFRALTVDRSVMHVDVYGPVSLEHPAVTVLDIDDQGFQRLLAFVDASFARAEGAVIPIPGRGYGATDSFFEANGRFNALVGCNTWTARALRQAGLRTGLWNPVPQSLALSIGLFNDVAGSESR